MLVKASKLPEGPKELESVKKRLYTGTGRKSLTLGLGKACTRNPSEEQGQYGLGGKPLGAEEER